MEEVSEMNQRLDIFVTSNMITEEEKHLLLQWGKELNDKTKDNEKIERMITHCAMMMHRKRTNDKLDELSDELFYAIETHKKYEESQEFLKMMNTLYTIPPVEERYILLHLCTCFSNEEEE